MDDNFESVTSLDHFFNNVKTSVDRVLDELIPSSDASPERLHQAMRWSLFGGGKRFRPALALAVGQAFGAAEEKLLRAAAAIEMVHTYSLIHDDLPSMDNDDLRRGRETCHKKFDEATAILAGDALQSLAFSAIAGEENLTPTVRIELIQILADAIGTPAGMVAGQQLDLNAEGTESSVFQINDIHRSKTGALIRASAEVGAIIGKASKRDREAISAFASNVGLLFQITDDIIDITQTTEILGKTAGKDVSAKKATFLSTLGVAETNRLAEKVYLEAVNSLSPIDSETERLQEIADYILRRKS